MNIRHKVTNNRGFTLMEILVAITIFAILGAIVSNSLFSLLRGANSAESIKELKQNGDLALNVMEIKLRNGSIADTECDGITRRSLTFIEANGSQTIFDCDVNAATKRIRQRVNPPAAPVETNFLTGTAVDLVGGTCGNAQLSFTCVQDPVSKQKQVNVEFRLRLNNGSSTTQQFQLRVGLRNK